MELSKKVLQGSIETLTNSRDNARNLHAASEKEKNSLQTQLNDSKHLVSELEDEIHEMEANLAAVNGKKKFFPKFLQSKPQFFPKKS